MKYNPNSPFMQLMSRVADIMLLNIVFIICCIPVFTIGASLVALYYTAMKMARNKGGLIIAPFFESFKNNFKQSTILWLASLAVFAVLLLDYYLISLIPPSTFSLVLKSGLIILSFLLLFVLQILFPFIAKFETTTLNAIKSSAILALLYVPRAILMVVISIVALVFTFLNSITFSTGVIAWILFGFAVIALIKAFVLNKIFTLVSPGGSLPSDEIDEHNNN